LAEQPEQGAPLASAGRWGPGGAPWALAAALGQDVPRGGSSPPAAGLPDLLRHGWPQPAAELHDWRLALVLRAKPPHVKPRHVTQRLVKTPRAKQPHAKLPHARPPYGKLVAALPAKRTVAELHDSQQPALALRVKHPDAGPSAQSLAVVLRVRHSHARRLVAVPPAKRTVAELHDSWPLALGLRAKLTRVKRPVAALLGKPLAVAPSGR
jgi:hypothetical protein